jgi:hypothetical protein
MILLFIFIIWLLIGYVIFRLQRSSEGEVEFIEGPNEPEKWYYHSLLYLLDCFVRLAIVVSFIFLFLAGYFDSLYYYGLRLHVKQVSDYNDALFIAPHLRSVFYSSLFLLLVGPILSLAAYFLNLFIKRISPSYYYSQYSKGIAGEKQVFNKIGVCLALITFLLLAYYSPTVSTVLMSVIMFVAIPVVFLLYFLQRFFRFAGLDRKSVDTNKRLLGSSLKQWFVFGLVSMVLVLSCPVYIFTETSVLISWPYRVSAISWSNITDLKLAVEPNLTAHEQDVGFDSERYLISVSATTGSGLKLDFYSQESKDNLVKVVDFFQTKGISIHCKVDPSLEIFLGGVDLSKLNKSEKDKFEILSYVNETCRK